MPGNTVARRSPAFGDEMRSQHQGLRMLLRAIDEVLSASVEPPEGEFSYRFQGSITSRLMLGLPEGRRVLEILGDA